MQVGVSITKSVAFRDSVQEFSNVYYYTNGGGANIGETGANEIIDALKTLESQFHSSDVTFVFGRCWWQTPLQATTTMLKQKALSGLGARPTVVGFDRERAWLFRRRAGNDERGQPVYLRKYYHSCGPFFGVIPQDVSSDILANKIGFSQTVRDAAAGNCGSISTLSVAGGGWTICAKNGRDPTEANWQCHRYLEHRQLGDQWRGA
jgi:hypothetical protein